LGYHSRSAGIEIQSRQTEKITQPEQGFAPIAMRIGIDGRAIRPEPDGIGRYSQQLIRSIAAAFPQAELLVWCLPSGREVLPSLPQVQPILCNRHHLSRFTTRGFARIVNAAKVDLFHSPFFLAPWKADCPILVTVHDLMALEMPDFFDDSHPLVAWCKRSFHRRYVLHSLEVADRVLAVSRWVAQRVEAQGVSRDKIRVLPNSVDLRFTAASSGSDHEHLRSLDLSPGFFLHVGRWKRYKNLPFLLEAYQKYLARTAREPLPLVLCRGGGTDRRVDRVLNQLRLREHVRVLQHIPDALLPAAYRAATALLQPSTCEGFGLPVMEAMACGTPVASSNGGALPEVCGDAGLILDAQDMQAWAEALERLATEPDLRADLRAKGLVQSTQFRPEQMTKSIAGIYGELWQQ